MWPFTRKPKPINPGPINEDWRVGDLAECLVRGGADWPSGSGPSRGDTLKVRAIKSGRATDGAAAWGLLFDQYERWYWAEQFRKVPPLNSEASAEFTAKIRRCKPAHSPAPVA